MQHINIPDELLNFPGIGVKKFDDKLRASKVRKNKIAYLYDWSFYVKDVAIFNNFKFRKLLVELDFPSASKVMIKNSSKDFVVTQYYLWDVIDFSKGSPTVMLYLRYRTRFDFSKPVVECLTFMDNEISESQRSGQNYYSVKFNDDGWVRTIRGGEDLNYVALQKRAKIKMLEL